MSDSLPTVWPAELHTRAKHAVLLGYLNAWFPILTRQSFSIGSTRRILYLEGFAGPGEYKEGEPGSPTIALLAARDHELDFKSPINFLFIENRQDRYENLQKVMTPLTSTNTRNVGGVDMRFGDCNDVIQDVLSTATLTGRQFGPALAFLDQFGYAGVSMELVNKILKVPQCEAFIYLDYKDMNRFITDDTKASGFTKTFGSEEWKAARAMPDANRRKFLLSTYLAALKQRGNAKYVFTFSMLDDRGVLLYWLIFCTNNIRGLEEMKRAMWKVDGTGNFTFSDKEAPGQLRLLKDEFGQEWLTEELGKRLVHKELTVAEVKEYVLTSTPCFLFKDALANLKKRGAVVPADPSLRDKRYSFADESFKLRFGVLKPVDQKVETGNLFGD